ncbi:quinone oxidoreductase family protein [Lederbergia citri]|uniref:Quinone oxidoreductase n=1 Tax=Lederbergia citri TaxID=2833580 RepID=A0A942YHB0_9BACI|nr:quinone oxidoreductase [Lederbergia citri]MBS4196397.1 quinone oxidoreductase [Lederbergia citri]
MKALVFEEFGGPEVLQYKDIPDPIIKEKELLVRMNVIGLNFADIYRRRGDYHLQGKAPYILGYEGSGIVEQVGKHVTHFKIGDRVGFADVPFANAELVAVPKEKAIPLPENISFEVASSVLLQGLTAQYLTKDSYEIKDGDTVLIHAASGGVGQNLIQICKQLGGKVIGLTSSMEKSKTALSLGANHVFLYKEEWVKKVKEVTDELGVNVVYDSVGSTLKSSLEALKVGGTVVFFGMSGGNPSSVDPRILMDTSKTLTGGDLWNVLTSYEERKTRSQQLFDWITKGKLNITKPTIFRLERGSEAHELLESRKSIGKILLKP